MPPPATPTGTVRNSPEQYPKMLFIYPRLLGRIQVLGVAPITKNTKDTQDPQHAGDPSYLGVGGLSAIKGVKRHGPGAAISECIKRHEAP